MSTRLFQGDQFVGYNVDPTTGDLILRYVFVVANKPDANGRGVTSRVMEQNKTIAKGRPLIFAPNEEQGGTKGHTNALAGVDPYKYEFGRILNIEPASNNLWNRIQNNLIQTNSSYVKVFEKEKDLWVMDVIVTNDNAKSILLNPATSHLIPRYVSPSFIHKRNASGDYSRVDDAIIDHVAIVNKPTFNESGIQIDGAAYGEDTRLRGACFGDKVACLNLLQTSSSKVVELDTCVSCPVQLKDRLQELFKNMAMFQIVQSSSSNNNMSDNNTTSQPNTVTTVTTTNPNPNQVNDNTPVNTGNTVIGNPLTSLFKTDETLQKNYGVFKDLVTNIISENKEQFRNTLLVDANSNNVSNPNNSNSNPSTPNPNNNNPQQTPNAENQQDGQTPQNQNQVTQEQYKQVLEKLNLKEDEVRNMKTEDIVKRFGDIKGVIQQVLEEQTKTARTLEQIRTKEEKQRISAILPREAFQDDRGFKQAEFDTMVNTLHKLKQHGLPDDYIGIMGVGLVTLKNEQLKVREQQLSLKNKKLPEGFGDSIRMRMGQLTSEGQNQSQQGQQSGVAQGGQTTVTVTNPQ